MRIARIAHVTRSDESSVIWVGFGRFNYKLKDAALGVGRVKGGLGWIDGCMKG